MLFSDASRRNVEAPAPSQSQDQLLEMLEQRVLLAGTPFPDISELVDPTNPVVRIETDFGDIDIELFQMGGAGGGATPITATNFINYVLDGDLDMSFFHRLVSGFVLQGGGFVFDDVDDLRRVPTNAPITNEFNNFALLNGANASVEALSPSLARIQLPGGTDLSGLSVGDWLELEGRNSGLGNPSLDPNARGFYEIVSVDDVFDQVEVMTFTQEPIGSGLDFTFFPRVNVERTIAMAKLGGDPNSATSQFFFNLDDNATNLDNQNGGFTVFGRVVDDDSWTVVTTIAALSVQNYTSNGNPMDPNNPYNALAQVPVNMTGQPISEDLLADIVNIELIKPGDKSDFFTEIIAYPEGYRADTVTETIELTNANAFDVGYQVIVRYEFGLRDRVVARGTLGDNQLISISLTDEMLSMQPGEFLTEDSARLPWKDRPYAIEIHATGVVGATLSHVDFGAEVGEDFFTLVSNEDYLLGAAALQSWSLGGVGGTTTDINRAPFLLLQNPTGDDAAVTIVVTSGDDSVTIMQTLEAYRRGGLELFSIAEVFGGVASVTVTSTVPIVASVSVYEQDTSMGSIPVLDQGAFGSTLTPGGATTQGALAGVQFGGAGENYLSFLNAGTVGAVVNLQFITNAGQVANPTGPTVIAAGSRTDVDLEAARQVLGLGVGDIVSVTFTSVNAVTGYYVSTATAPDGSTLGDTIATRFVSRASGGHIFSGGRLDVSDPGQREVISVYNPHQTAGRDIGLNLRVFFSDGTSADIAPSALPMAGSLPAGDRVDIDLGSLSAISSKLTANPGLTYSVRLLTTRNPGGGAWEPSVVSQFTRFDEVNATAFTSIATWFDLDRDGTEVLLGTIVALTDAQFGSGGGT